MPSKLRIGAVAYLNTRPLVLGLEQGLGAGRIELSYDVPSVLADRMQAGELDIALLPIIELARMPELSIVPGLGIVTDGATRSVLLVGRRGVEQVESVALDPESRTSNALTRVLFAELWGRTPRFEMAGCDFAAAFDKHDTVVRIGDKALFERPPADASVVDLGEAWTARTTLPFVFAVWAARPGVVDREVYGWLHESRRRGSRALREIAADYAWHGRRDPELCHAYLEQNIRFGLGSREVRAMRTFFAAAAGLALIERAPEIRMALDRRTVCHDAADRLQENTV
jgi:chorismate dehydratase